VFYIYTSIIILLGAVAPRFASALTDYLVVSVLFFGDEVKPRNLLSLSLRKLIYLLLFAILPMSIGITNTTFDIYQLGRFALGYVPFFFFMLLALSVSPICISRTRLLLVNKRLRFIVSAVVICAVLKLIFPNQPFPIYILTGSSDSLTSFGETRLYPLASATICSLASLHRLKNGYIYVLSALITVVITQGKTLTLLTLVALLTPYIPDIKHKLTSLKISTKIIPIFIMLLCLLLSAPWSRIIDKESNFDINPLEAQTTRNIMALDAVNNTMSNSLSALFGLGFATKTNQGYFLLDPQQQTTDENHRLIRNSQYSTENFYGSSLSRFGIVGLLFIIYVTCLLQKKGKLVYFFFFTLIGLGSGIIEDPSFGSALIVLYFSNNYLICSMKS